MIFRGIRTEKSWVIIDYDTTWYYGYDFMLDAAQEIISMDYKEHLDRVAFSSIAGGNYTEIIDEVRKSSYNLYNTTSLKEEHGALMIAGFSQLLKTPIQFAFFNQTRVVRVFVPNEDYFKEHGDHVLDNYMNSIEIKAYCRDTEKRVIRELKEGK